jgi:hypothetical protein
MRQRFGDGGRGPHVQSPTLYRWAISVGSSLTLLTACGGSLPSIASTPPSRSGVALQPGVAAERSLDGYYLAKLTTVVGSGLPSSTLCMRFKTSGSWTSSGSENFRGTYYLSHKDLYASGVWLRSPPVFLGLIGFINAKNGSGKFIISGINGYASGGGAFTMTREQTVELQIRLWTRSAAELRDVART